MALDRDLDSLKRVALFAALGEDEVRHLAFGAEPVRLTPGRWLFRDDQPCDGALVLVSGRVATGSDEDALRAGQGALHDAPGTMFGETGLIVARHWRESGLALDDGEALRIPRALFLRVLSEYPASAARLRAAIGQALATTAAALAKGRR